MAPRPERGRSPGGSSRLLLVVGLDRGSAPSGRRRVREPPGQQPLGHALRQAPGIGRIATLRPRTEPPQLLDDPIQSLAADILHREVVRPLVLAHAEHRHDVRVVQPRRRPRLEPEPLDVRLGVAKPDGRPA